MTILTRLLTSTVLIFYTLLPTLRAQQTGLVSYPILPTGISTRACSPTTVFIPVAQLKLNVKDLKQATPSASAITDGSGYYTIPLTSNATTFVSVTSPTTLGDRGTLNAADMVAIRRHILRIPNSKITCPYLRIAADVTNEGVIDNNDISAISRFILGITSTLGNVPFVRLIPKAYTMPDSKHPDPQFVADFWNENYTDDYGKEYPFSATVRYNNSIYTYNGTSSWVGKLNEWRFPGDNCESKDWGFIAVISGDVQNDEMPSSINNAVTPSLIVHVTSRKAEMAWADKQSILDNPSLNESPPLSKMYYKVSVLATTQESVGAFQLQVDNNNEFVKILDMTQGGGLMTTDLSKSMNQTPLMLNSGKLRMLWVSELESNAAPFTMKDTPLFSYTVSADKASYLENIGLDATEFPALFFDANGKKITAQVRFKVEKTDKPETK